MKLTGVFSSFRLFLPQIPKLNPYCFPNSLIEKSLVEQPYNISVIQISSMLPSSEAEAPTPKPATVNITDLMSAHGCKNFAEALLNSDAMNPYEDNINGGLTIFCPLDDAFKGFMPKLKNLTIGGKQLLLDQQPLVIFTINKVLLPKELIKGAVSPASAPAPEADAPTADSPKPSNKKRKSSSVSSDSPKPSKAKLATKLGKNV